MSPDGITFTPGVADNYGAEYFKTINHYTFDQWQVMQASGALFLPTTGYRDSTYVYNTNAYGYYWSSTASKEENAFIAYFGSGYTAADGAYARNRGFAVRLATDYDPNATKIDANNDTPISIYTSDNTLYISTHRNYQIYNLCGTLIYSGNAPSLTLARGIYIIKCDDTTLKIIL